MDTPTLFNVWFVIVGLVLVAMALSHTVLKRLPLTTSMLYLALGAALGVHGASLITWNAIEHSLFLERATEAAAMVSLFVSGLKLRLPMRDPQWRLPLRLAFLSMTVTVGLIALVGVTLLHLPLGAAVLLGAIIAPTDPVLASDVQVEDASDRDRLRFGLTGEAGLNDGTAFPFVMLGLGLLGLHDLGPWGWRWWAVDVVWAVVCGLGVGALFGTLIGRLVLYLRQTHKEAVGTDDFLALGLIALSYGAALLLKGYGFLAVFAAGVAIRRIERKARGEDAPVEVQSAANAAEKEELATHPEHAPAQMAQAALEFNEQLERIGEVTIIVLVGGMLTAGYLAQEAVWFAPLLFLIVRPVAVWLGTFGLRISRFERRMMSWFGVRGVGSIYYLMYAIQEGLPRPLAERLTALTLTTVAASIVVHGVSVTPLMNRYRERRSSARPRP